MARKKELIPSPELSKTARLIQSMLKDKQDIDTATGAMAKWRYIDFVNPTAKLPCLSLEWLFGSRGLLAGRILQLRALFSKGKSSFMYLEYAMAQLMAQAFCLHVEAEGAQAPADYVGSFGCDPSELLIMESHSLEDCLARVDDIICRIRGGFDGGVNPDTGRKIKSKYTDPLDPAMQFPIAIGIDSLSSLGKASEASADVIDVASTSQLAYHSRKLREYFRNRVSRFRDMQVLLMLATHETSNISTGGFGGSGGSTKTSIAQNALGGHATWGVDVDSRPYYDKKAGKQLGDIVKLYTFKNKISPRYRTLELPLVWDHGFDLIKADWDFLSSHVASPFLTSGEKLLYKHAHGVTCKPLSDKSFANEEEFLRTLYDNAAFVASLREQMRIRGCGFDFERNFAPELDIPEDEENTESTPEDAE